MPGPPMPPLATMMPDQRMKLEQQNALLAGALAGARAVAQQQTAAMPVPSAGMPPPLGGMGAAPPMPPPAMPPLGMATPGLPGVANPPAPPLAPPPTALPAPGPSPMAGPPPQGLLAGAPPPPFALGGQVGAPLMAAPSAVGANGNPLPSGVVSGQDFLKAMVTGYYRPKAAGQQPLPVDVAMGTGGGADTSPQVPADLHAFLSGAAGQHSDSFVRELAQVYQSKPEMRSQLAGIVRQMISEGDTLPPELVALAKGAK